MKFSQCYTDVTKVTGVRVSQKSNVTMLQCYSPSTGLNSEKYVNYHKLFCWTLKSVYLVTLMLQ